MMYKLPLTNEEISDGDEFINQYRRIGNAVKKATGFELTSFGSVLTVAKNGTSLELSNNFAIALIEDKQVVCPLLEDLIKFKCKEFPF